LFSNIYFCNHLRLLFFFLLDQLRNACGGNANGVDGKEDLKKVKEILSQYRSLLNEDLDGYDNTSLIYASMSNSVSVVVYLLSCDGIKVNKQNKV
jgi:hypothetical protein